VRIGANRQVGVPSRLVTRPATVDLLVVGAGPAGAAAAMTAARAGLTVAVHDKARFPRDKICGDGLTTGALRLLEELGLDPRFLPGWAPVHETVIVSPRGRHVALPHPRDGLFAGVVPRQDLDVALVELARDAGAVVHEGSGLVQLDADDAGAVARFDDGAVVRAPWVLAADGTYSMVRRLLDPSAGPAKGDMHAFRQYVEGWPDDRLWVLFEPDLLPGYAWVFPVGGGRANVGFGVHRSDGVRTRYLAQLWDDLLARPSMRAVLRDAQPVGRRQAWPIPASLGPLAEGRVLFVGDAASATDPLTGEGIAQALWTGMAAVRAVQGGGSGEAVRARYAADVEADLAVDLRFARQLLGLLGHRRGCEWALRAADLNPWTRTRFARWMFEDYPRALLKTPRRWHRGAMSSPGAFARV
jgi:menaquinone-9 beta-reductase